MKKKVFCILLSLICFSLSAQQRIIGGYTVDISDRPFQAFVACNNGNRYNVGGGVIISPQWILTAAHVVTDDNGNVYPPSKVFVTTGSTSVIFYDAGDWVSEIIVHPDYVGKSNGYENDIALVKLYYPLTYSSVRQPALVSNSSYVVSGTKGIVSGWGKTSVDAEDIDKSQLRAAEVNISSSSEANGKKIKVSASTSVAYSGDSGGPLTIEDSMYGTLLVGLVSYGIENETTTLPSYYTNVGYYYDWIKSQIGIGNTSLRVPSIIVNQGNCSVSNLPSGASVDWRVGNTSVASINNQGVVTEKAQGVTSVFADVSIADGTSLTLYTRAIIGVPLMYITRYDVVDYPSNPSSPGKISITASSNQSFSFFANPTNIYGDISLISFNFHWRLRNSSGSIINSRTMTNCGLRIGFFNTTFPSAGNYTLEVDVEYGGKSVTYTREVEVTGSFRAAPNPVSSQLNIQQVVSGDGLSLASASEEQVTAQLYSNAALVRSVTFEPANGAIMDVSSLSNGIYYLVITDGEKIIDRQTIIVKH